MTTPEPGGLARLTEAELAALKIRHSGELMRAELDIERAARLAITSWLADVELAYAATGSLDNAVAQEEKSWAEEVATILAALFLVWRKRYRASGGRLDIEAVEWAKYADRVRPALLNVRNTILGLLRTRLASGPGTGSPTNQFMDPELIKARALVIAHTEVPSAYNGGAWTGFQQYRKTTGRGGTKMWLSVRDARVRETHRHVDGQRVPVAAPFVVGGFHAQYPGDPSLPAHEVANCRCVAIFELV